MTTETKFQVTVGVFQANTTKRNPKDAINAQANAKNVLALKQTTVFPAMTTKVLASTDSIINANAPKATYTLITITTPANPVTSTKVSA